ncbi:MAG: PQQ-binding-like beta-propeller repeat protein [candidate division WOR-3 bacterium]|nr:PQQ-binding-like beta-propeller repeat protein [candidate division WOR-3 bacterium]
MKQRIFIISSLILLAVYWNCGNKAPNKPQKPDGPSSVIPGVPDTFSTVTTDPEGDNVKYQFGYKPEGGTESYTNWSDLVSSGTEYKTAITLTQPGKYYLRCQAKDQKGKISKWSDNYEVACGYGIQKWFFTCYDQQLEDYAEFNSTPAIDDQGNIYLGCSMGHIHALRPNGTELWRYPVDGEITSSIALAANGTIYACTREGKIYALYSNGTLKWQRNVGSEIVASPAIGQNNEVYVCTIDEGLFAIDANNNLKWVKDYIFGLSSVAVDRAHNLYVGSYEGFLFSLDSFGDMRWNEPFDAGDEIISSPAITPTGKICFGTQAVDSNFIILNPDGTVFKKVSLQGSISASPVIGSDGSIYIATEEGVLYRLNANGNVVWNIQTNGSFASSPAVVKYPQHSEDVIYFRVSWAMKGKKSSHKTFQDELDTLFYIKSDRTRLGTAVIPPIQYASAELISSPMVGSDGTIYIGGGYYEPDEPATPYGGVYAFSGRGVVANSCWPLFRQNRKNSGRIE